MNRRHTVALIAAVLSVFASSSARAQTEIAELLVNLETTERLVGEALEDAIVPLGGLLGRISPSSGFATDRHGLGYFALSGGITAIQFEMTNPDYTSYRENGNQPEIIEAPSGAVFLDGEVGLYRGYDLGPNLKNVGTVDLLLRYGLTIGDQPDLNEDISASDVLDGLEPIYGAGLRIGLLRGDGVPAVSFSLGFNHFVEREFGFSGEADGYQADVGLAFEQTSSFYLLEAAEQFGAFAAYGGVGAVNHELTARWDATLSRNGASVDGGEEVSVDETQGTWFGGLEFFANAPVRLNLEAGALGSSPYATLFLKIVPIGR